MSPRVTIACATLLAALFTISPALPQAKKTYKAPRTPDGQPDISGFYSNATVTPFERPPQLGAKEFYTEKELDDFLNKPVVTPATGNDAHYDLAQYGLDTANQKIARNLRTSWIIGPDGKLPPMTPEAQKRTAEAARDRTAHSFDSYEYRSLSERCLWWQSEGPPMTPFPGYYNANLQILQGPGYVVIQEEMIHDARVIPLDNRPRLSPSIRQWFGDSRGHWDGETLVVDTTNFSSKTAFRGATESLHVIERFTRTGPDTVLYQFTVEDPATWTRPWSGESPMVRIDGPLYEYACHEGNLGMPNVLSGARAEERQAASQR